MAFLIGTPHTRGAGYFRNDNRPSGGQQDETDIQSCPHCQSVIKMQEWRRITSGKLAGGYCIRCDEPICWMCVPEYAKNGCMPFLAKIDRYTDHQEKLRQFRKLAGLEPPEPARELIVPGI